MIKILACACMVIDHIGLLFFPDVIIFRLIGRQAMPLFAYCLARGFYFSKNRIEYIKRIIIFAIISQVPYMLMEHEIKGNIGVLWLCALLFLYGAEQAKKNYTLICFSVIVTIFMPIDYGLYGLLFVLILYYYSVKNDKSLRLYIGYALIHALLFVRGAEYGLIQLFTLPCLPILDLLIKIDGKVKVNRNFFYLFYPIHMLILETIRFFIK